MTETAIEVHAEVKLTALRFLVVEHARAVLPVAVQAYRRTSVPRHRREHRACAKRYINDGQLAACQS